jgi:membrane dipeptidase
MTFPTRRHFLGAIPAANLALFAAKKLHAAPLDSRVNDILAKTIAVDMHAHVRLEGALHSKTPLNPADMAQEFKRAGVAAICMTEATDGPLMKPKEPAAPGTKSNLSRDPKPGEMYQAHLKQLDLVDEAVAKLGLARVRKMADLRDARKKGQPAFIQDAEGGDFIEGHLERVQESFDRGLRKIQLMHYAFNTMGDFQSGHDLNGGLTSFGAQVVKECNRLGIVVDLAHATFATVKGAAKATTQPLVLSHTSLVDAAGGAPGDGFRGGPATMTARQVTADHARAIAETGGVVGIWHLFDNTRYCVQAVKAMADVVGVDHVGIGTDFGVPGFNKMWPDETTGLMYNLIDEMLKQGFTPEECGKIAGGNFCRAFEKIARG